MQARESKVVTLLWPALVLLLALGTWACRGPERKLLYDLTEWAAVAELESEWDLVRFGTPAGELLQERGFRRAGGLGRGGVSALVRPRSTVPLIFNELAERQAFLEISPEPGLEGSVLEIAVNRNLLGRFTLAEGRQRLSVTIPASAQREGRNRLRLLFPELEARHPDRSQAPSVARLFHLVAGLASDSTLRAAALPEAPSVLVAREARGIPELLQAAPSALGFAVQVPEHGRLSFEPDIHGDAPADRALTLRVEVRDSEGREQRLWERKLTHGEGGEPVDLDLPGAPGSPLWLTLRAGVEGESGLWARWRAPRITGTRGGDPLVPSPPSPEDPAVAELARSLRGMNVLVVLFDALRARQLGCMGYPHATTPQIDRLAAEGVLFERAYTPAVFTYAAVGSMWTSQHPDQGQSEWLKNGMLPANRRTLAELLGDAGIHSAAFLASPSAGAAFGLDRGFTEVHDPWRRPRGGWEPVDAAIFRESLFPWIAERPTEPFFAYVHYREPHGPLTQPPLSGADEPLPEAAHRDPYRFPWGEQGPDGRELDHLVRLYDGNLAFGDRELGALRAKLEAAGLWERTVVIVTADHGEELFEHGLFGHNIHVYEESTHIPLVIRFPEAVGVGGVRVEEIASLLDLAPTILQIMGVAAEEGPGEAFQGRSLLPSMLAASSGGASVSRNYGVRPSYGYTTGRFKYIYDALSGAEELYDLDADPGERNDLLGSEPLWAAVHRQALQRWMIGLRSSELAGSEPAQLDEQAIEALKALGYLE